MFYQPQAALDYYLPNAGLARRITRGGRAAQMFGAMAPDPAAPTVPVPAPRFHDHQTLIAERLLATKRLLQEHFVEAAAA